MPNPQLISAITLGMEDLARSRAFYVEGFGWTPVFENEEIVFYQMNGLMLGTWLKTSLANDAKRGDLSGLSAFTLAHNVADENSVQQTVERLVHAGGKLLRAPDVPPPGGLRGYVADPDDHIWEIAFNPAWTIDESGWVHFGV
ncbi:VOC family protein [Sphingomonas panacisoli]|uniref:VOC family protein n=2 Tax=Sphingomonas panacisoli TaxID=1813879 RepID=A0A5B8LLL3_9SPHN|nr:VOC family protein [Sphingomonas panacisoli]